MKAVLFDFYGVVADVRMAFVGEPGDGDYRLVIHHGVVESILRLREAGVRTALVTNNDREPFAEQFPEVPLDEWFDVVVFSSDVGVHKPDHKVYRYALSQLDLEPEDVFYFDDVTRNVDSAARMGIAGHIVREPSEVPDVVEELLAQAN